MNSAIGQRCARRGQMLPTPNQVDQVLIKPLGERIELFGRHANAAFECLAFEQDLIIGFRCELTHGVPFSHDGCSAADVLEMTYSS